LWPHKFIFNRDWYEKSQGQPEFDDFESKFSRLSVNDRAELLWLVSSSDPRYFKDLPEKTKSKQLREILRFYIPLAKGEEEAIWERQRNRADTTIDVPDDERVEDAGLSDNVIEFPITVPTKKPLTVTRHSHV